MKSVFPIALAACLMLALPAHAQMGQTPPKSETAVAIEKALASPIRTAEERARDMPERKPVQTLEFFGLKPDMSVVEIMPGAGWYTKILGQVLAEQLRHEMSIVVELLQDRLEPGITVGPCGGGGNGADGVGGAEQVIGQGGDAVAHPLRADVSDSESHAGEIEGLRRCLKSDRAVWRIPRHRRVRTNVREVGMDLVGDHQ